MMVNVWYLTTDTAGGLCTELYGSEEKAQAALRMFVSQCWEDEMDPVEDGPIPDDVEEAWNMLCETMGFVDSYLLECQVVEVA